MKNQLIPTLRFPQFSNNWESKKLGNIAKFSKGKGISKSDIIEDGKNECIRYGELYTAYNEVIKLISSRTNVEITNYILSEENDVIIPSSGETQLDIATASCVLKKGVILGGDLNIIKSKVNGVFLSYLLNNSKKKDIAKLAQGNAVVHLYNKQLATLILKLPSSEEQQKIATFLTDVDDKITKLTKKKTLLEQYKKGIMQKIFNQELRFKDDNGDAFPNWEEKKLGEVSKITTGSSNRQDSSLDGEYTFFDRSEDVRTSSKYLFDGEAVIVAGEGSDFIPKYYVGKFDLHQRTYAIMDFKYSISKFIYFYVDFHRRYFLNQAVGSTVKSLRLPMFQKMPICLPKKEEQTKIANFLSDIDLKIKVLNTKIENSKSFKKGLLQKMFV
ncbi:restriction endonuclease subunit S [Tenacibaculum maritimum]|nr:restriction endonuclease subunit S [Tenacibaculum maritimum]MDB0612864.1 restriction endonuclease subunit S [Tenacibaculum maritimum]